MSLRMMSNFNKCDFCAGDNDRRLPMFILGVTVCVASLGCVEDSMAGNG